MSLVDLIEQLGAARTIRAEYQEIGDRARAGLAAALAGAGESGD